VLALVLPLLLSGFRLGLLGRFLCLAIVALGIDLIWGFTGLLSLGHGIFFALGGYAFAMYLQLNSLGDGQLPEFFGLYGVSELPFFLATVLFLAVYPDCDRPDSDPGGRDAGLFGVPQPHSGVYFSILTQAALVVFFNFFNGQQQLINGTNGLKTDTSVFLGQEVGSAGMQGVFYIITVILLALVYALCRWITSGRFGRLLVAIRDDENRVRFSGYDPTWFKVLVFALSGSIAGIAGALYTVQSGIVSPSTWTLPSPLRW
jgi:urea transport system permease protein